MAVLTTMFLFKLLITCLPSFNIISVRSLIHPKGKPFCFPGSTSLPTLIIVFSFQVSNCLWTLDVTVLVIDMKHAEKRTGQFCCCDKDKCEDSLSELGTCNEGECDIVFSVTVSPCTESSSPWPCSVSTVEVKNAENVGNYGYFFHFTTTAQANNVRCTYNSIQLM